MLQYCWICQNRSWICLNMSEFTIIGFWVCILQYIVRGHSSSWWALIERWAYSEPGQRPKMECFGKIIIVFNYFCKKHHLKSLRGFSILVNFHKYDSVLNMHPALKITVGQRLLTVAKVFMTTKKPCWTVTMTTTRI